MTKRFITLDAMRGVAALAVVYEHSKHAFGGPDLHFADLAVDFFFALSGFVLAHTYDPRFERGLSAFAFMRQRAVRLYPLFALGLVTGALVSIFVGSPSPAFSNLLLLPAGPGKSLFPGDDPAWSLFFKFWVANLAWAVFWRQLRGRMLSALLAASGAVLLAIMLATNTSGTGWEWGEIGMGSARVTFSFFLGVWLSRRYRVAPPRIVLPPGLSLGALAVLFANKVPEFLVAPWLIASVFIAIPVLVYYSAEAIEERPSLLSTLGNASYAVYATHWAPLVLVSFLLSGVPLRVAGTVGYVILAGLGAVALDRFYDRPLSAWLKGRNSPQKLHVGAS